MNERKPISKSVAAVSVAIGVVLLLVIAVFVFGRNDSGHSEIILPETQQGSVSESAEHTEDPLLQITTDNVVTALSSLQRPSNYTQVYLVRVGQQEAMREATVEIWVSGRYKRAVIQNGAYTKTILSDGESVWLWYASSQIPRSFRLSEQLTFEDLIGLPAFDYLQTLQDAQIAEAEYLVLERDEQQTPCIFVSAFHDAQRQERYWIDLQTGLLCDADCLEENTPVYLVEEQSFDLLADGDEAFSDKFLLPDGMSIVTEEINTQPQQ